MIATVLASALIAATPPPAAAPAPQPPAPPSPATPSTAAPSIDSLLQSLSAPGQTTDGEEDSDQPRAAAPAGPGPVPYAALDVKAYDQAILETAAAARARGGPLEGGWTLQADKGKALYRFQFADQGQGLGRAEGAWRDLNGGPRLQGSGFISLVGYDGDKLMLRFYESGPDDLVVVTVKPSAAGDWSGELWRKGATMPVEFRRE